MITILLSTTLGGLLLLAGIPKLRNRKSTLPAIQGYRLLPQGVARLVALVLPAVEVALGLLLVVGAGAPFVPAAAAVLFSAFFAGLAINLLRGRREFDCGCFAFTKAVGRAPTISWFHAVRAVVLAALAGALLLVPGGYGIGVTPVAEHLLGLVLATLVIAIGLAAVAVREVVNLGRHAVDVHLAEARHTLPPVSRA